MGSPRVNGFGGGQDEIHPWQPSTPHSCYDPMELIMFGCCSGISLGSCQLPRGNAQVAETTRILASCQRFHFDLPDPAAHSRGRRGLQLRL